MNPSLRDIANSIDQHIRKEPWFNFHVTSFDGRRLIVAGSIDLGYYHKLEVVFENVFFVCSQKKLAIPLDSNPTSYPIFVRKQV